MRFGLLGENTTEDDELAEALGVLALREEQLKEEDQSEEEQFEDDEDLIDLTNEDDEIQQEVFVHGIRIPVTVIPHHHLHLESHNVSQVEDLLLECLLSFPTRTRRSRLKKQIDSGHAINSLIPDDQLHMKKFSELIATIPQTLASHAFAEIDGVPIRLGLLQSIVTPSAWLNDEAINGYFSLLSRKHPDVKFMSTFFYTSLMGSARRKVYNYEAVSKWTRKLTPMGIFGYSRVIIPINQNNSHWSMIHIDMIAHTIEYYDSLGGARFGKTAIAHIQRYLRDEFMDKVPQVDPTLQVPNFDEWVVIFTSQPRQHDGGSCGVFISCYAQSMAERIVPVFSQDTICGFRRRMAFSLIFPFVYMITSHQENM
ncbi:hypothetical protein BC829DRAFT_440920 [Chytridium lagenaria]|nr:hypothetical protein BC829DRAFT_440920 [Chytridium lagenaria]